MNTRQFSGYGCCTDICMYFLLLFFGAIMVPAYSLLYPAMIPPEFIPRVSRVARIIFAVNIIILYPLMFAKSTRTMSFYTLSITAAISAMSACINSFMVVIMVWDYKAAYLGLLFFGIGVVPVAITATIVNGLWSQLTELLLLVCMALISRIGLFLYAYLDRKADQMDQ